jgi:hypothetical protein
MIQLIFSTVAIALIIVVVALAIGAWAIVYESAQNDRDNNMR